MPRHWVLQLDPNYCTDDELTLSRHGRNFDHNREQHYVRAGDVAVIFDSGQQQFCRLGRFMAGIATGPAPQSSATRYDFLVDLSGKRASPESLSAVRRKLVSPRHPLKSAKWRKNVVTPLTPAHFDDLMEAWWGIPAMAQQLEATAAAPAENSRTKYTAYTYAFERMQEAVARGFNLEAVSIAESLISDRLLSACRKGGLSPKSTTLSSLISDAKRLVPPLPNSDLFDHWRKDRNRVIHGIVKSHKGEPLLPPVEFISVSARAASDGLKLARLASNWAKKIKSPS